MGWDTRLAWSGELDAAEAVVLQRFDEVYGAGSDYLLPAAAGPDWEAVNWTAATAGLNTSDGRRGGYSTFNTAAPATERTAFKVPYFEGLWPSSGKVVLYAWGAFTFSMAFTPILSTRNTPGAAPLAYLSTMSNGVPRAQVYNAAGTLVRDEQETPPWTPQVGDWVCYMLCVDLDANTSQLAIVRQATGQVHLAAVRTLSGQANTACTADLFALTLSPTASYWASGWGDEFAVLHKPSSFDFTAFVDDVRRSTWARGSARPEHLGLSVSDGAVTAVSADVLLTGAEAASWSVRPDVVTYEPLTGTPSALLSTDNGATWSAATPPEELPASFSGLVRWQIPLALGEAFTGLELVEPVPVPVVDPLPAVSMPQRGSASVTVTGTWQGAPIVEAVAPAGLTATVTGTTVTIGAGLTVGEMSVAVTVTDATAQTSEPVLIPVTVTVEDYEPGDTPNFPHSPIIVHDADGEPDAVIVDAASALLLRELNGEQTLTFTLPLAHPHAATLVAERTVTCADDLYRIRRLTAYRDGNTPMVEAFAEARWYDLRTAGRVRAREWSGVQAGDPLTYVLAGTGWTVGAVTVTTRRTWSMENETALSSLRTIAEIYGGDLIFDNHAKTVSLLETSGRDQGTAFFHGNGLSDARRVEDTTQLLTRIEPRNEEGVGIEAVNGGVAWLEDFSFIDEIRHGVYNYASGTSPQTMLAMTVAAIGKRAKPSLSYEATISDLSAWSGQAVDRFDIGDTVLLRDIELGIETTQRIVSIEYNILQPWESRVTLSEKLRSLGSDDGSTAVDAGVLDTGASIDTRDLVPFNLLKNGRFDNGLAHWAASGATVVDAGVTGPRAIEFTGSGTRWIEQTVATDTRDAYTLSLQVDSSGGPSGWVPDLRAEIVIVYDDDTTETIELELS